eukprot:scaffold501585_cov18-Prasinocladus_malaysianus.AAC.1
MRQCRPQDVLSSCRGVGVKVSSSGIYGVRSPFIVEHGWGVPRGPWKHHLSGMSVMEVKWPACRRDVQSLPGPVDGQDSIVGGGALELALLVVQLAFVELQGDGHVV